jgi:hypothetical protein
MRSFAIAAGLGLALLALPALAQAPAAPAAPPVRVRGAVEKLDGNMLMVKSRDGSDVTVDLASDFKVRGLERKKLSDIKAGDYVASTGRPGSDGKLHAVEVRIFPEALRGAGEGQFPWDLTPDSVMTNATVAGVTTMAQGETLKVNYKGKESEYVVDPSTPILSYTQASPELLKPGTAVFVIAQKQPDGKLTSNAVTAESNGIKPPM